MVTATVEILKREEIIQRTPKTQLESTAEMLEIPLKVRPWWGSLRDNSHKWLCAGGENCLIKKYPEIQNGIVILWEGACGYEGRKGKHTHSQTVELKGLSSEPPAMLISLETSASVPSQFLIGMDESLPFFVPVGRHVLTIEDAFVWLMPKPVKMAVLRGLEVVRQGDWFFYPSKYGPKRVVQTGYKEFPVHFNYWRGMVYHDIPLIDENVLTRHQAEEGCYMSAKLLVKGWITAPSHKPMFLKDWHEAVRNKSLQGRDSNAILVFGDRIVKPQDRARDD